MISEQEAEALQGKALRALDQLTKEDKQRLQQASVFARVSPEQKLKPDSPSIKTLAQLWP